MYKTVSHKNKVIKISIYRILPLPLQHLFSGIYVFLIEATENAGVDRTVRHRFRTSVHRN